ncbi:MAG: response regulator [Eubacteriales bacterium]|nr:response regulator [Eubacteriales bacterium]
MKTSIYIVDDERMAIKYLKYLLESVELEYEVVGEGTNSLKALSEIIRLKPDIVFADINMPVMDGLELSEEILKHIPAKIFLLTSYRDFDYVKKGLRIGAADYILKNELTEESLKKLLEKTVQDLMVEKKEQHLILEYNIRHFLLDDSNSIDDHVYEHRPMQRYALINLHQPPVISMRHHTPGKKLNVDCFEVQNLTYPHGVECSAFTDMGNNELCGIFFINSEVTDGQVVLEQVCGQLTMYFSERELEFCCLISDTLYHFFELQDSYRELHRLAEYIYACPGQHIFKAAELRGRMQDDHISDEWMEAFNRELNKGEPAEALGLLRKMFEQWRNSLNIWEYTENLQNIDRCFRAFVQKRHLNPLILDMPEVFPDTQAAEQTISDCLERIFQETADENKQDCSPYVQQALTYIRKNYRSDIAIPDIAREAGISEGHLRRLFKQEMNMKVLDYLTEYRLECAKTLMKNTEENVNEIWRKTGFTSAQYFSYVFKKKEGVLPKDYMRQVRNGQQS